ncbi:MAG: hypothetical protein ACI9DG_001817, partial [Oleispira sp.]
RSALADMLIAEAARAALKANNFFIITSYLVVIST